MPLTPILPSLRQIEGSLHKPDKPGWDFRPLSELKTIANSLNVTLRPGFTSYAIDAIPDLWARLLLFDFALREPDHPLHGASIAAFRGFLSFLALSDRKNLNLQTVELDLSRTNAREFRAVVQRLRPETLWMAADTAWEKIFVFTLDSQAVGITSPLTLVCPAEGTHLTSLAKAGWCFDGLRFRTPEGLIDETDTKGLADWVAKLGDGISDYAQIPARDRRQTMLVSELSAFEQSLRNKLSKGPRGEPEVSDQPLNLSYGMYQLLAAPLKGGPLQIDRSMVQLRCLRPKTDQKNLLIIDDTFESQWNTQPSSIVVANGFSLKDILSLRLSDTPTSLGGGIFLPPNTEWRRPDTFFTDRLVLIRGNKTAFPGAHKLHGQDDVASRFDGAPIVPLRPELLSYLTADHIRETAFYEPTKDGIRFGLRLPLQGNRALVISQEYGPSSKTRREGRPRPIIYQDSGVPVLEVWPNFASPSWKTYLVFWDNRGGDVFHARPFGAAESSQFAEKRPNGLREREVTPLSSPPEFLLCSTSERQADGDLKDVESGILLPRLEPLEQKAPAEFHIGVDFGTSNTNVYMRKEGNLPAPLRLETVPHPVTAPIQSDREASLYRSFLPPAGKAADSSTFFELSPFLSFFRTRVGAPEGELQPIKHGHILFYNANNNDRDIGTDRVSTRLKWGDQDKTKMESYLRQVCIHSAVEAFRMGAKKIHWYYSLPTAFPAHKVNDFRVIWANIVTWVSSSLGVKSEPATRQTESVVAAKYFASLGDGRQAFPSTGAAFIDIGGGTSDISIWQDNSLLLQCSIRLSGEQIILDPLFRRRHSLLRTFPADIVPKDQMLELEKIADPRVFYAKTDALFRSHGEKMVNWLVKAPDEDTQFKRFIDYIGLGLCGLFFYTGLMFRHLMERNTFHLKSAGDLLILPSIHVGGNGCKLFHWVAKGAYSDDASINEMFRSMLLAAADMGSSAGRLRIHISDHPKAEAACGLVVNYDLADFHRFDQSAFDSLVAGEQFTVDNKTEAATTLVTREIIQKKPQTGTLESLYTFVDVYNKFAQNPGLNLEPILNVKEMAVKVHQAIDQWTNEQAKRETRKIELEPLFIVALKAFLAEFLSQGGKAHV